MHWKVDRWNQLHPDEEQRKSYLAQCFRDRTGPYIAATDYMKIVADQIQGWGARHLYHARN